MASSASYLLLSAADINAVLHISNCAFVIRKRWNALMNWSVMTRDDGRVRQVAKQLKNRRSYGRTCRWYSQLRFQFNFRSRGWLHATRKGNEEDIPAALAARTRNKILRETTTDGACWCIRTCSKTIYIYNKYVQTYSKFSMNSED